MTHTNNDHPVHTTNSPANSKTQTYNSEATWKLRIEKLEYEFQAIDKTFWVILITISIQLNDVTDIDLMTNYTSTLFTTGNNTLRCDWRFEHAKHITMHVVLKKHFF